MSLMLAARWRALKHVRVIFPRKGCRIWRLYRYCGFDTLAVVCSCGEIFGQKPEASGLIWAVMQIIQRRQSNQKGMKQCRC
jgi:hypothetical protein